MFTLRAQVDGAVRALDLFTAEIADVDGLLRDFARLKRIAVRQIFRAEGPGWDPRSPATLAKLEAQKAKSLEQQTDRAVNVMRKKLAREYKRAVRGGDQQTIARRLFIRVEFERIVNGGSAEHSLLEGVTAADRAVLKQRSKITRDLRIASKAGNGDRATLLRAQLDRFDQQHDAALLRAADARLVKSLRGLPVRMARAQAKHGGAILGGIGNSISAKVKGGLLTLESKIDWSGVHNDGGTAGHGARIPARPFLYWTDEDWVELEAMAQDRALAAFEGG